MRYIGIWYTEVQGVPSPRCHTWEWDGSPVSDAQWYRDLTDRASSDSEPDEGADKDSENGSSEDVETSSADVVNP